MGLRHLSTGDLLRESVAGGEELGMKAKTFMDRGLLVPDEVMLGLIREQFASLSGKGWILDGFPRTLPQAEALSEMLEAEGVKVDHVLLVDVGSSVVVERVSGRRVCGGCKAVYNIKTLTDGEESLCEKCGGKLVKRPDDEEATILRRFEIYKDQTKPVLGYYQEKYSDNYKLINGDGAVDDIAAEIIREIR